MCLSVLLGELTEGASRMGPHVRVTVSRGPGLTGGESGALVGQTGRSERPGRSISATVRL